jgi:hypothetical protein
MHKIDQQQPLVGNHMVYQAVSKILSALQQNGVVAERKDDEVLPGT